MTKGRKQTKPPGENAAFKRRLERAEAITSALVADVEVRQRLDKLEVVRTPSPTTTEPAPEEPQKPETE